MKPGVYKARFGPNGKETPGPIPFGQRGMSMYVVVAEPSPGVEVLQDVGRWEPWNVGPMPISKPAADVEGTCQEVPKEITDGLC